MSEWLTNNEGGPATWTYDLSDRMITALTTLGYVTYGYSINGNLSSVNESFGLTTMSHDWENRLGMHQSGGTVASYLYYADSLKAVETVSGAPTTIIWDGQSYLEGRRNRHLFVHLSEKFLCLPYMNHPVVELGSWIGT